MCIRDSAYTDLVWSNTSPYIVTVARELLVLKESQHCGTITFYTTILHKFVVFLTNKTQTIINHENYRCHKKLSAYVVCICDKNK